MFSFSSYVEGHSNRETHGHDYNTILQLLMGLYLQIYTDEVQTVVCNGNNKIAIIIFVGLIMLKIFFLAFFHKDYFFRKIHLRIRLILSFATVIVFVRQIYLQGEANNPFIMKSPYSPGKKI